MFGRPVVVFLFAAVACRGNPGPQGLPLPIMPPGVEALSLTGDTLRPPPIPPAIRAQREALRDTAHAEYIANQDDADALIWYGRRTAYLGLYREAIEVFTEGIAKHPDDARMFRHRGHRWITVREFDRAIADFERAAALEEGQPDEIEPDGLPNARGIPTSTLQGNIWYHLGLARYVTGDLEGALDAYRRGMDVATNPDMTVATAYWQYMTLRRLDRDREATEVLAGISADMDIIENQSYHRLLLLNTGELAEDDLLDTSTEADVPLANATVGYGVGNWHFYNGREAEARQVWRGVLQGVQWSGFGYIAAEAHLHSLEGR